MSVVEQILLSAFGILLGFFLSQSFNVVRYLRRPKFRSTTNGGVISGYTGGDDEPAFAVVGFYLENCGWSVAKKTRIFISSFRSANSKSESLEEGFFYLSEVSPPLDIIPPGEAVRIELGRVIAGEGELRIQLENSQEDIEESVAADTRNKFVFEADFHIVCEEAASHTKLTLTFDLTEDGWDQVLLDEFRL